MSASQPPLVYFILGTPDSGRREIVRDLIDNGLEVGEAALVLVAEGEPADTADAKLAARSATQVQRWKYVPPAPSATPAPPELPDVKLAGARSVFFLADSHADPITQLEALKPWLARHGAQLARILCVVDCQFAEKQSPLRAWYAACIHFSDVVFLTKREGVANKWLSDFLRHYQDEYVPAHFIQLKKTGVANPALVLDPSPRRVSQYFDEAEDFSGLVIETDDEEDEGGDGEDGLPEPEPYFERQRSGRRVKELPDIRDYLPAK
ncbi:MAG: hypothetical protein HYV95_08960 [Opitutae bacterium]|nr:hypothetical protein [Opitutae bacterium]